MVGVILSVFLMWSDTSRAKTLSMSPTDTQTVGHLLSEQYGSLAAGRYRVVYSKTVFGAYHKAILSLFLGRLLLAAVATPLNPGLRLASSQPFFQQCLCNVFSILSLLVQIHKGKNCAWSQTHFFCEARS